MDAINNSLPIPPHTLKDFNDPDLYIVWTKLVAPGGGGLSMQMVTISLTPAQIQVMNTIPVLAVPGAPGKTIIPVSMVAKLTFNTTAYQPTLLFVGEVGATSVISQSSILTSGVNADRQMEPLYTGGKEYATGGNLVLLTSAASLIGDSPVEVTIVYYLRNS